MAIPVWPSSLPDKASRENFNEGSRDGRLRTQMEGGPAKTRLRFSSDPKPVSLTMRINVEQWNAFDTFWAANKVLPFWFLDQTRGDVQLTTEDGSPIYTGDGAPLKNTDWWLCMFGDARPAANNLGAAQYSLSFNLAIIP